MMSSFGHMRMASLKNFLPLNRNILNHKHPVFSRNAQNWNQSRTGVHLEINKLSFNRFYTTENFSMFTRIHKLKSDIRFYSSKHDGIEKNVRNMTNPDTQNGPEKKSNQVQIRKENAHSLVETKASKPGLYARFKLLLMKQNRPFNIDEITAFFSWIVMGNFLWILIGTTTFLGFLVYVINWIDDGEIERIFLRNLLTLDNRLNIDINSKDFKSSWEDGKIKLKNLKIISAKNPEISRSSYVLNVNETSLTFSLNKWLDGKGLIEGIEIDGLEGDVNIFDGEDLILDDSFSDNYELKHLKIKHSKINFHSENYFNHPLELVVFNCDLDRLRRKWIVYDFLNANSMFGSLGGSLFTLHKRQHKFAHFNGMDLHDQDDDKFNKDLNKINENRGFSTSVNDIYESNESKLNDNTEKIEKKLKQCKSGTFMINNDTANDNTTTKRSVSATNDTNDENDIWKKITRLRIDMLDLSFLNNENSKLNWINSGKAEVIFDIMLPNEDDDDNLFNKSLLKDGFGWKDFSFENLKRKVNSIVNGSQGNDRFEKNDIRESIDLGYYNEFEQNKYVVIDMKINYYNLTAKYPSHLPCSSLTGLPYISSQDLQSLITFINDEKFGLSSSLNSGSPGASSDSNKENPFDGSQLENDENFVSDLTPSREAAEIDSINTMSNKNEDNDINNELVANNIKVLPPIKFRIVQNLKDFEYLDLPSLVTFTSMTKPDAGSNPKLMKTFINTNKFIDNSIVEVLALLLVYKEEIQTQLIDMYAKRSGYEILFNNLILGNLILVGLGSFVI